MLRARSDHAGGFYIYDDYAADISGSVELTIFLGILGLAFLYPFFNEPSAYIQTAFFILLAFFIQFFLANIGNTEFLSPLATPFYCYAAISASLAIFYSSNVGTLGLLLAVIVPVVLFAYFYFVFSSLFLELSGLTMIATVMCTGIVYFSVLSGDGFSPSRMYMMRVVWLGSLIKTVIMLLHGFKVLVSSKKKIDFTATILNLTLFALGFIPLFILKLLYQTNPYFQFIAITFVYIGLVFVSYNISKKQKKQIEGDYLMLLAPLLLMLILCLAQSMFFNFPNFFLNLAYSTHLAICNPIAAVFTKIITIIINIILIIFDTALPIFHLHPLLAYTFFYIYVGLLILIVPKLIKKGKLF